MKSSSTSFHAMKRIMECYTYRLWSVLQCLIFLCTMMSILSAQKEESGESRPRGDMNIIIKDDGIVELVKGDAAIIFYLTATNIGHQPIHLSVNCTRCCQKFPGSEEDCESMIPLGGDMGELFPQDTRNLTLIYPTLHAHDRAGYCDMVVSSQDGKKMERTVKFNTTLPRTPDARVPRLLEDYYSPDDIMKCEHLDQDPLNLCRPVTCLNKYTGYRNYFNATSQKCEKLPACISKNKAFPEVAYVQETNTCYELKEELTEEEKREFHEGRPSVHELTHSHRYPINLRCHQGTLDKENSHCECKKGWSSAPLDPATFNFDVQVYHMCNIWTGEMTAKEAANITFVDHHNHPYLNYILFSVFGGCFVIVAIILAIYLFIKSRKPRISEIGDGSEATGLVQLDLEQDRLSEDSGE